jgi:AcrR family transcriptional regulator
MTAEQRRAAIIEAATAEFAERGLHGTSVDTIARRAGITQPYVFRLFGTKKGLYLAVIERMFARVRETFEAAAAGAPAGGELQAMGEAYGALLLADRTLLLAQLQAYAACDDADIRRAVQTGFGGVYACAARLSRASEGELRSFFATGMLLNVAAAMDLRRLGEGWVAALVPECLP